MGIGLVVARREEEALEYNQSRARAAVYLEKCRPEYIEDDRDYGLAPDAGDGANANAEVSADAFDKDDDDEDEPPTPTPKVVTVVGEGGVDPKKQESENVARLRARQKMINDHRKLIEGAFKGYRYQVQSMCRKAHVNINHRDVQGRTALYLAAERGHIHVLRILLSCRAKMDIGAALNGWMPLHAAAFHGQIRCVEELIEALADLNARDDYGCTPISLVASSPKIYLVDLTSKRHRMLLQRARQQVVQKLNKKVTALEGHTDEISAKLPPDQVWTLAPTRTEIILMETFLNGRRVAVDLADRKKRTPLIYAARYGRTYAVSRLLHAKANIKLQDSDGRTPLMLAASHEHIETVALLLRAGASVNVTDQYFRTPLHGALESGDEAMVMLLLDAAASVNAYDCEGRTPILLAMDQQNRRLFSAIVQRRSNLDVLDKRGWNVVIYAIETGMLAEITPLLKKLGDKAKPILRAQDPQGRNALQHAAMLEDLAQANIAVDLISKLDYEAAIYGDCNGDTALHMAAELGRLDTLRLLVQALPSADYLNNRGETPLHYAAHGGHLACVVALIDTRSKRGPLCDAGAVDYDGRNLLMHACVSGHLDLVNLLLQNREGNHPDLALAPLDVNLQDKFGVGALSVAAREGHWHLLPSLVLAGANYAAKDNDGFTALHWAASEDESLVASCLLDLGMDPDSVDGRGWTPMMTAVARGCDEALRVLVDRGANLDARNWDGDTAMQICLRRKDPPEMVRITSDILTDGSFANDCRPTHSIECKGYFIVSVLDAVDLYMEGKVGEMNTYVCVQLRTHAGATPFVAFTSCVLRSPSPDWHEVFRFDVESIDPSASLVAWVISAPGETAEDVIAGAELGLSEEELVLAKLQQALTGKRIFTGKPDFSTALQTAFQRLTRRADRNEDKEVQRIRRLAIAQSRGVEPTMDLVAGKGHDEGTLESRRWNEVSNLRGLLERSGCDIQEPLVPRTHLPLGCVVINFRHLRAAVWGTDPVQMHRTLRLNCRGNLRVEVDFRPRFFDVYEEPRAKMLSPEEEDELYRIRPVDPEDASALLLSEEPVRKADAEADGVMATLLTLDRGRRARNNEEVLFKRFVQVLMWSQSVVDTKKDEDHRFLEAAKRRREMALHFSYVKAKKSTLKVAQDRAAKALHDAIVHVEELRKEREFRRQAMDRPIGDMPPPPPPASKADKKGGHAGARAEKEKGPPKMKLPRFQPEPWLEELLDGSRLI